MRGLLLIHLRNFNMRYDKQSAPTDNAKKNAKSLRREQTPPEAKLWRILRGRRLGGYKFRRQYPIGRFITDFYCHEVRLIIELDGASHENQIAYDLARSQWLASSGYQVMRFSNQQLNENVEAVGRMILIRCVELGKTPHPSPLPRERGQEGCAHANAAMNGHEIHETTKP